MNLPANKRITRDNHTGDGEEPRENVAREKWRHRHLQFAVVQIKETQIISPISSRRLPVRGVRARASRKPPLAALPRGFARQRDALRRPTRGEWNAALAGSLAKRPSARVVEAQPPSAEPLAILNHRRATSAFTHMCRSHSSSVNTRRR